jgi:hypothetical protein
MTEVGGDPGLELADLYRDGEGRLFFDIGVSGDALDEVTPGRVDSAVLKVELVSPDDVVDLVVSDPIPRERLFFTEGRRGLTVTAFLDFRDLNRPLDGLLLRDPEAELRLGSGRPRRAASRREVLGAELEVEPDCLRDLRNLARLQRGEQVVVEEKTVRRGVEVQRKDGSVERYWEVTERDLVIADNERLEGMLRESRERMGRMEAKMDRLLELAESGALSGSGGALSPPPASADPPNSASGSGAPPSRGKVPGFEGPRAEPRSPGGSLPFLGELKDKLKGASKSGQFKLGDILKPMSEEELSEVTLSQEELMERRERATARLEDKRSEG